MRAVLSHPVWLRAWVLTLGLIGFLLFPLSFASVSVGAVCELGALAGWLRYLQRYGLGAATKLLLACCVLWALAWGAFQLAVAVPSAKSWVHQDAYQRVLTLNPELGLLPLGLLIVCVVVLWVRPRQKKAFRSNERYKVLPFLALFFILSLLVSNITTQKISHFWGITVDVGTWFFPITYIFNDVFTEVYGYRQTRKYIWATLLANVLMVSVFWFTLAVAKGDHLHSFQLILYTVPRIFLASVISFFCGEFFNAFVLAKLKIKLRGRWLPVRTISSTALGVAVDTSVFVSVAFIGVLSWKVVLIIALWEYVLKVGYEILATPITCAVIKALKRIEHADVYDTKTRFSPFLWAKEPDYKV